MPRKACRSESKVLSPNWKRRERDWNKHLPTKKTTIADHVKIIMLPPIRDKIELFHIYYGVSPTTSVNS
ncbi:hypothetical protein RclHR1_13460001 [Rhizophagus clarus]|uniref:Uncharacterized protein n=1 Tax=Rhizophagus clarus TaxID=94130 RepID=A0A2Z6QA10_9GLOM|nr:hypothetical protein RclHR1_13460001 [Rhizophagus clarus]GES86001.1 hypothetical protein RCL_jg18151.t1 [Rhizophagus clarus]